MRTLYLLRPHGTASLDGEQLVVSSGDEELDRMALPLLDQILVLGTMQLTTQLIGLVCNGGFRSPISAARGIA